MDIALLETESKDGEVIRLQENIFNGSYSILRGQYVDGVGRFNTESFHTCLEGALAEYCRI